MVARDPMRPKASDITDLDMLYAIETYTAKGAPFPPDQFALRYPAKVAVAKAHKIVDRGWADTRYMLTKEGRAAIERLEQEGVSE
jgi:hypothetical protein